MLSEAASAALATSEHANDQESRRPDFDILTSVSAGETPIATVPQPHCSLSDEMSPIAVQCATVDGVPSNAGRATEKCTAMQEVPRGTYLHER